MPHIKQVLDAGCGSQSEGAEWIRIKGTAVFSGLLQVQLR